MYRYEELNLQELWEEPDFSAESPEGLYAIAQCYRLGKGTEVNRELYRNYLQAAVEAGYTEAEEEWKQLNEEKAADMEPEEIETTGEQPEGEDLSKCTLSELMKRLEQNEADMGAHYEIYRRYRDLEPQEALRHLERAAELVERGGDSLDYTLCQRIFMDMGAHCEKNDAPEKCLAFYGRASELGSREADNILAEYYKTGYGSEGKPNIEKSLFYRKRALKDGTDRERYELGLEYIKCGKRIAGDALLEEVENKEGVDPELRVLCKINRLDKKEEEVVQEAWALGYMQGEIGEYLYNYYKGKKPEDDIPKEAFPTAEQAYQLGLWNQKASGRYGSWMEWSAQNGCEQAIECLEKKRLEEEERRARNEKEIREQYEIYQRYCETEPQEAFQHLEKAAELVEQGGDFTDQTLCRNVFLDMGAYCAGIQDEARSLAFYERAAELGSREADRILADYYRTGYGNGGKPDKKKSLLHRARALKDGTDQERYELGLEYIKFGEKIKGCEILKEIKNKEGIDAKLRILCEIHLPDKKEEEVVRDAWALGDMQNGIGEYLYSYYKEKKPEDVSKELLPTPEQAFLLGLWNQEASGRCGIWMEWAAQNGSEAAKGCLREEHLRDIAQEQERQRQEEERKKKERLERERQEMERQRQARMFQEENERQERQLLSEEEKEQKKTRMTWIFVLLVIGLGLIVIAKRKAIGEAILNKGNEKTVVSEDLQEIDPFEDSEYPQEGDSLENSDGLQEVDPFEDLQIKVSGSSPFASVEVAYIGMDPFLQKVEYTLSREKSLKDGENILIEASVDPSVASEYKKKLSTPGMTYTVQTEDYWITPDTEVTPEQLRQISELAESYLRSEFKEGSAPVTLDDYLNKITGKSSLGVRISAEFENVQFAAAYMVEKELPSQYKEWGMVDPKVGWLYCVLETVGSYKDESYDGDDYGRIESPIYYVVPICARCDGGKIVDFDFNEPYFHNVFYTSLEDAEFEIYKDLKPSQKLEF